MRIYLIDDEASIRLGIGDGLRDLDYEVFDFADPLVALEQIVTDEPDCVLCDLRLPGLNGLEVLRRIHSMNLNPVVIIITAYGAIPSAVECLKEGAFDYLTKPFSVANVQTVLRKAESITELNKCNRLIRDNLVEKYRLQNMIGSSRQMKRVFECIERIAPTNGTVLIEGETGTGKEIVADAIHAMSLRKDRPFIKVSCAIFSQELLESELFGHVRGAFTGAIRNKTGRFEMADGGTIFLDEIDDIPISLQVKLLRFMQNRSFERVGAGEPLSADVRILAATKTNLAVQVEQKKFRPDLYYRLNVLPIRIPSLHERSEDVPLLVSYFLEKFSPNKSFIITPEVINQFCRYCWPGNVRQLENVIERLVYTVADSTIRPEHLPPEIINFSSDNSGVLTNDSELTYGKVVSSFERTLITDALNRSGGNKKRAAQLLGMPYSTFRFKFDRMGNAPRDDANN